MILNLYSIYDIVAKEYGPLWHAKNDDVAIRQFTNLKDRENAMVIADYILYKVGTFNNENATFRLENEIQLVIKGDNLVTKGVKK